MREAKIGIHPSLVRRKGIGARKDRFALASKMQQSLPAFYTWYRIDWNYGCNRCIRAGCTDEDRHPAHGNSTGKFLRSDIGPRANIRERLRPVACSCGTRELKTGCEAVTAFVALDQQLWDGASK